MTAQNIFECANFIKMQREKYAFSFAPCGWYAMYYCGVIQSLRDLKIVPTEMEEEDSLSSTTNENVYTGASAGALASFVLAYRLEIKELVSFIHEMSSKVRKDWRNNWNLQTIVQTFLVKYGSKVMTNKALWPSGEQGLRIQITNAKTMDQVYINKWNSYDDLRNTIVASCSIPGIVGPPHLVNIQGTTTQMYGMDGAFSTLQPSHPRQEQNQYHQVSVSPFGWFSGTEIRPSVYMPMWWAFYPPDNKGLDQMYHRGYNDTIDWHHRQVSVSRLETTVQRRLQENVIDSSMSKGYVERMIGYENVLGFISCQKIEKILNWIFQTGFTSSVGYIVKGAMNKTS